jgi:ATP phosphoribosyltransferase regulatory subunit
VPAGITKTREPLQVGAELYGHSGLESDLEVQRLMLQCLTVSCVSAIKLDLGHVTVFRGLIKGAGISHELEAELYAVLQAKDVSTLRELCVDLQKQTREALLLLPELYGDHRVLADAASRLPDYPEIRAALNELSIAREELKPIADEIAFDLADLRGYHYHTGMVFAAYTSGCSNAIALGGRYDEIGKAFGRARPATGFSMDLRELSRLMKPQSYPKAISAPYQKKNTELEGKIKQLRKAGQIVVVELPGQKGKSLDCDRELILHDGQWIVKEI